MAKQTLSSQYGRPTYTLTEYLRKFGLQYADLDAMIISYPEAFDHCYNRLLQLVYNLIIIDNEPESIEDTFLKFCIFVNGKATFFRTDAADGDVLRALNGAPADIPDVYYMPEDMLVENPTFSKQYQLKRGKDCEVVYCRQIDRYTGGGGTGGLGSLIRITAQLMADNILSLNIAQKNTRLSTAISADDEATKRSAEEAMRAMYAGEPFKVIMSNLVGNLNGIPVNVTTTNRYLIDLISAQQYILAHFYEQIGLQTHDQLKKERLITDEVNDNADLALYNIYSIIESINEGLDRVNAMFGTDMHAYLNPLIAKQIEQPAEEPPAEPEPEGGETNGTEENSSSEPAGGLPADNPGTEILTDAAGISEPEEPEETPVYEPDDQSDSDTQGNDEAQLADDPGSGESSDEPDPDEEQRQDREPEESSPESPENNDGVNIEITIESEATPAENEPPEAAEETPEPEPDAEPEEEPVEDPAGEAPLVDIEINIEGGEPDGTDRPESPDTLE